MWFIDNRTPFAAERGWVRDRHGAEVWLVAAKCTFNIRPDGRTEIAEEQPPVLLAPEYTGEPGASSIRYDADLVPSKRTTDIVVNGHAVAPTAAAVTDLDVGFEVGSTTKFLKVVGDRRWERLGASPPERFVRMPLTYERAYGGRDSQSAEPERDWFWRNPVGRGFFASGSSASGALLPNIYYSHSVCNRWNDRIEPAGFGVISTGWEDRARFGGTYDTEWEENRNPLLPDDFDDRFYQSVPPDQQTPRFLVGGEEVVLHHLADSPRLSFRLPRVFLRFRTHFFDGEIRHHPLPNLHTVIIEPDFPRVSLVWHTALPCHAKVVLLERTIVTQKPILQLGVPRNSSPGQ